MKRKVTVCTTETFKMDCHTAAHSLILSKLLRIWNYYDSYPSAFRAICHGN